MFHPLSRHLLALFATLNYVLAQSREDVHWSPQFGPPGGNRFVVAMHAANGNAMLTQNCAPENSCPIQFWNGSTWNSIGSLHGGLAVAQGLAQNGNAWYIGGSFTNVGGVSARNIAMWDGSWHPLGDGIAGYPGVLLVHKGILYAAGQFDNGAQGAPMFRRFNGTSWEDLGTSFPSSGGVYALVSDGDDIIAGGLFSSPGVNVARFDGTSWNPLGTGLDGQVNALAVWNGQLYASGDFTGGMARWNGSQWVSLGATFRPRTPSRLQPWTNGLYLSGDFTNVNNVTIRDLARFDGQNFERLSDEVIGANIFSLGADADKLYFAGDFGYVDSGPGLGDWTLAQGVGTWNGQSFDNLYNPEFSNGVGFLPTAVGEHAGQIYVGGTFRAAGDASANYIARWDGAKWNGLGSGLANRVNTDTVRVDAILSHNGEVFVGGAFSHAGDIASPNIAIWTSTVWRAAGEGLNGRVRRLVEYQGSVVATGAFSRSGAQTIFFVARWNGSAWEDLGACCLASLINSQAAHEAIAANESLYVGGVLLGEGGIYTNSVYQLIGQNYIFLGGFNRSISSLAYHNGELYVSGQFTRVNGTQTITNLAKWNGSSWTSVASPLNAQVTSLSVHRDRLYIAGNFTNSATVGNLNTLARLGDSDWEPLGSGLWNSPPAGARPSEIYSDGENLWIAGIFSKAGAVDSLNFARWNDQIDFYAPKERVEIIGISYSNGNVTVSIKAPDSQAVMIESTTDFIVWDSVGGGAASFQITIPALGTANFLRARTTD